MKKIIGTTSIVLEHNDRVCRIKNNNLSLETLRVVFDKMKNGKITSYDYSDTKTSQIQYIEVEGEPFFIEILEV